MVTLTCGGHGFESRHVQREKDNTNLEGWNMGQSLSRNSGTPRKQQPIRTDNTKSEGIEDSCRTRHEILEHREIMARTQLTTLI